MSNTPKFVEVSYVFVYDTTSQPILADDTWQDVNFSNNGMISGWTHVEGSSVFTCTQNDGDFCVEIEYNVEKSSGGNVEVEMRALFNGVEIPGSHNGIDIDANHATFSFTRNFGFSAVEGQDLILQIASNDDSVSIKPAPSPAGAYTRVSATVTIERIK